MMKTISPLAGPTICALCLAAPALLVAEPDPDGNTTEFQRMLAGFGNMETIAGRLVNGIPSGSDACNDWTAAMEGGNATDADLSRPHMAQADAAGNVYIADKEGHAIRKVSPDGVITTFAGTGLRGDGGEGVASQTNLREPNGLYTFPDGTTYLLEIDDNCETGVILPGGKVRKIATNGMMTTVLTDPNLTPGRGLWVSPDESLIYYCSGTVLRKWTPLGGIEDYSTGYLSLGNIAMGPDGLLVVTDRSSRNIETGHYVYRLSADGATRTIIAGNGTTTGGGSGLAATATGLNEVRGIAMRPDGSFFVCTHRASQLWFIDTQGLIWLAIDGNRNSGTHAGDGEPLTTVKLKISEPRAVTLAPNGDLIITENDDGYIRRVTNICVPPEITKLTYTAGGTVTITWRSHREGNYTIEESTDLIDWNSTYDPETGNGPTTTATVGGGSPTNFFRVVAH